MNDLIQIAKTRETFLKALNMASNGFAITPKNKALVESLILWLDRDEKFNRSADYNGRKLTYHLNKSICLIGAKGCGKSTIMYAISAIVRETALGFTQHLSNNITDLLVKQKANNSSSGDRGNEKYGNFLKPVNIHIDELGFEPQANVYGVKMEAMQEIIHDRHRLFTNHGAFTHICSNLTMPDMELRYGDIIFSRILEMCNIFILDDKDYRPEAIPFKRPDINAFPRLYISPEKKRDIEELQHVKKLYENEKKAEKQPYSPEGIGTKLRKYFENFGK